MTESVTAPRPDYPGPSLSSAAEALRLLDRYEPSSVVSSLADSIIDHAAANGVDSLTGAEAEFAALDVLQKAVDWDGFASIFYNEADYLAAMLRATEATGAMAAHALILRGLALLKVDRTAGAHRIRMAAGRILKAIEMEVAAGQAGNGLASKLGRAAAQVRLRITGSRKLLRDFERLDKDFSSQVQDLLGEMVSQLRSSQGKFRTFR